MSVINENQANGFLTMLQDAIFPEGFDDDCMPISVCTGEDRYSQTQYVLRGMGAPDDIIFRIIQRCQEHGGHSDVDILLNVTPQDICDE